jgi:hypothetical protein
MHAVILSDDDSIDDKTKWDDDYMGPWEGDSESAEDATLDEVDTTDNYFHWKGQDKVG